MKIKQFLLFFLSTFFVLATWGQVSSKVSYKRTSPTTIDVVFTLTPSSGYHIYGKDIAAGGPTPAQFGIDNAKGIRLKGGLKEGPGLQRKNDPIFEMPVTYFNGTAVFTQTLEITDKNYEFKGYLTYGACNDENCLPPTSVNCTVKGADGPAGKAGEEDSPKKNEENQKNILLDAEGNQAAILGNVTRDSAFTPEVEADSVAQVAPVAADSASVSQLWKPVIQELNAFGNEHVIADKGLLTIFLLGFGGGLLALLTPCVWPIIPMTVSFFLKRNQSRKKGIADSITYGVSIVVIYLSLGLLVTFLFGASYLNELSTSAFFNILFFLMLLVFGASFLGGFEITLPTQWGDKIDTKANNSTGLLSIFLMAFTLALVSFSCTGPIIGFLLVEVTTTNSVSLAPTIGMLGFALALALPFTLFALFPTLLKKTSRGGSWMNQVKVCLGFLELAFALKFLSVADLAYGWGILDRETFLALWIALFTLLACYLFGFIKFPHDDAQERNTSVPAFMGGILSLAFAIYMVPGLWGAPTKAVSAFAPPMNTQDFNLDHIKVEPQFKDYEAGMAYARQHGKPVLVDFTGFGCVNCRKMEMSVWHDAKVRDIINNDYVLISLYVDDKTPLPAKIEVEENGQITTLRTVGDRWSYLQRTKFGANAQPFYVLLDGDGKPLAPSYSYDENIEKYVNFLETGKTNFKK